MREVKVRAQRLKLQVRRIKWDEGFLFFFCHRFLSSGSHILLRPVLSQRDWGMGWSCRDLSQSLTQPAAFKEKETARSVSVNCDKGSHICAATRLAKTRCNIWLRTRRVRDLCPRDWRSTGVEKRGHSSPGWSPAGPKQTVDMCHPLLTWWG